MTTSRVRGPADNDSPLRLGLAGFGQVARQYYVPAFRVLRGVEVRAVADPLPNSRAAAREQLPGVKTYPSPGEMLAGEVLDGLLVASPPSTHLTIWVEASRESVPVFMEKPFLLPGQLARLEDPPAARRLLMVNFNRRFWPAYRRLGALVRAGHCGTLRRAELVLHTDVLSWCLVTRHRLAPGEGGVLYDLGSQVLDLVRELVGAEPVRLAVRTTSARWPADHVELRLAFADGLQVHCDLAYAARTEESVVIEGTAGRLRLRDPNMALHFEAPDSAAPRLSSRLRDVVTLGYRALRRNHSMARLSIRESLATFLHSLRSGKPFSPGFDDAVRIARWLDTASRAAAENAELAL